MDERHYRRAAPWPLVLTFAVLALTIGAGGRTFYQRRTQSLRLEIQVNLASIASLKIDEISEWRRERLDDASEVAVDADGRRAAILELLAHPQSPARASLLGWLGQLKERSIARGRHHRAIRGRGAFDERCGTGARGGASGEAGLGVFPHRAFGLLRGEAGRAR